MTENTGDIVKTGDPSTELMAPGGAAARFNWTGLNPSQMKSIAQAMAMSGMFPDIQKDSAKAFVKIMAGQEMGIAPFQAMSDISIISGKASAGGNIYAAKVKSSGRYDYRVKKWDIKGCEIEFFEVMRGRRESLGTSSFLEADAQAAQLLGKGNWKTYPRNMYFNRAMTAGVRTFCPDALGGINAYTPEELGANVDEDGRFVSMDDQKPAPAAPARQAAEAEVIDPKTVLQLIGEELEAKGFDDKLERQKLAFAVGGVEAVAHLNDEEWAGVLETIKNTTTEELGALLKPAVVDDLPDPDAEPLPDEPAPEKSVEQAMADGDSLPPASFLAPEPETPEPAGPRFVVPDWKFGATKLPRPEMRKLYKELIALYAPEAKSAKVFNQKAIGKDAPSLADDFINVCNIMADELNSQEQGTLV
jgi:hypothetical protein